MTTVHFEYDPERLIEEIKKRPGIWDYDNVAYRSKAIRQKLWTDVVKELVEPNVKFTKCELRELGKQYVNLLRLLFCIYKTKCQTFYL